MEGYEYRWEKTRGFNPIDPRTMGEHLEKLEERDGQVTCQSLLDSARPQDSDAHPCYEWNDEIAAEKYRLRQSNDILNSLVRIVVEKPETAQYEKVFVNVSASDKNGHGKYVSINTAFEREDYRSNILSKALAEMQAFRFRYNRIAELANVFTAIDEAVESIKKEA